MQLFPVAAPTFETSTNTLSSSGGSDGFNGILASYIEEGRYDYTGRPGGFPAYGPSSGTIDGDTGSALSKELRKRNVSEETVAKLETLLASGSTTTIGTIFSTLSGKGRYTEQLNDEETTAFQKVLAKLGFKKEELDELTALGAEGDAKTLFGRIITKLESLEGTVELTKDDWAVLLKGLDASNVALTGLAAFFAASEQLSLTGAELKAMLTGYRAELGEREAATAHAREEMRDAMVQALAASKARQRSEPASDSRGTRRSEQSESLMQNSVRKNTGLDDLKREGHFEGEAQTGDNAEADLAFESPTDGKSRSECILATNEPVVSAKTMTAEKAADTPQPKIVSNITIAPDVQVASQARQSTDAAALTQNNRQEILAQVEQGLLQSAMNGGQRLTLQLNPAELGAVTVVLSVHQGEVKAAIRAENQESADILRAQLADLKASLEAEGLKVKELDVQTGLSEQSLADRWDGHQEHNRMRDATERDRMLRLTRIRREATGVSGVSQLLEQAPVESGMSGLHVVA